MTEVELRELEVNESIKYMRKLIKRSYKKGLTHISDTKECWTRVRDGEILDHQKMLVKTEANGTKKYSTQYNE